MKSDTEGDAVAPLSDMVEREAKRVLSETQLKPDPARVAQGWERRFLADAERAEEAMELYARLGYEVCADPVRPDQLEQDCLGCPLPTLLQFTMIYTRKKRGGKGAP